MGSIEFIISYGIYGYNYCFADVYLGCTDNSIFITLRHKESMMHLIAIEPSLII